MYISQTTHEWKESFLKSRISVWTFCLNQSLITLRLEKNAYLVIIKCSSCFSIAQGPNILYKGNTKLQQKLSLCLLFFLGVSEIIYFFIQYYIITIIANCGIDCFSQIGMGWAVQYTPVGLLTNYIWMSVIGSFKSSATYQAFHQGTYNTTLLFIHDYNDLMLTIIFCSLPFIIW